MTFTEQAVFGNSLDGDIREHGTGVGFTRLQEVMAETFEVDQSEMAAFGPDR
jgi:hypothetical protein